MHSTNIFPNIYFSIIDDKKLMMEAKGDFSEVTYMLFEFIIEKKSKILASKGVDNYSYFKKISEDNYKLSNVIQTLKQTEFNNRIRYIYNFIDSYISRLNSKNSFITLLTSLTTKEEEAFIKLISSGFLEHRKAKKFDDSISFVKILYTYKKQIIILNKFDKKHLAIFFADKASQLINLNKNWKEYEQIILKYYKVFISKYDRGNRDNIIEQDINYLQFLLREGYLDGFENTLNILTESIAKIPYSHKKLLYLKQLKDIELDFLDEEDKINETYFQYQSFKEYTYCQMLYQKIKEANYYIENNQFVDRSELAIPAFPVPAVLSNLTQIYTKTHKMLLSSIALKYAIPSQEDKQTSNVVLYNTCNSDTKSLFESIKKYYEEIAKKELNEIIQLIKNTCYILYNFDNTKDILFVHEIDKWLNECNLFLEESGEIKARYFANSINEACSYGILLSNKGKNSNEPFLWAKAVIDKYAHKFKDNTPIIALANVIAKEGNYNMAIKILEHTPLVVDIDFTIEFLKNIKENNFNIIDLLVKNINDTNEGNVAEIISIVKSVEAKKYFSIIDEILKIKNFLGELSELIFEEKEIEELNKLKIEKKELEKELKQRKKALLKLNEAPDEVKKLSVKNTSDTIMDITNLEAKNNLAIINQYQYRKKLQLFEHNKNKIFKINSNDWKLDLYGRLSLLIKCYFIRVSKSLNVYLSYKATTGKKDEVKLNSYHSAFDLYSTIFDEAVNMLDKKISRSKKIKISKSGFSIFLNYVKIVKQIYIVISTYNTTKKTTVLKAIKVEINSNQMPNKTWLLEQIDLLLI